MPHILICLSVILKLGKVLSILILLILVLYFLKNSGNVPAKPGRMVGLLIKNKLIF